MDNYTQAANAGCFDLIDTDLSALWEDIENTPEDTTAQKWQKKLAGIGRQYSFSSRYALIRILTFRASGEARDVICQAEETPDIVSGFDYQCANGETLRFRDIPASPEREMSPAALAQYQAAWEDTAERCGGCTEQTRQLIARGLRRSKRKHSLLTREEALRLGHALRFSLQEMQWFLLRVFEVDAGLRYHRSGDLIDAYGYLAEKTPEEADALKAEYQRRAGGIPKRAAEEKPGGWTRENRDTLFQQTVGGAAKDEAFLRWMVRRAPFLDTRSGTALRVYRNLAVYACARILEQEQGRRTLPSEDLLYDKAAELSAREQPIPEVETLLYRGGAVSPAACGAAAKVLLRRNRLHATPDTGDNTKVWHVITLRRNGEPFVSSSIGANSRTRVQDLLAGEVEVEKYDLLYLLWFLMNLRWNGSESSPEIIYDRMDRFTDTARQCLENAMLPAFYPPHLMEQSMLLSIACSQQDDPAAVYETICQSLIKPRNRDIGVSRKHTPEEKRAAVAFYRAHRDWGLKRCARELGDVSFQSLGRWNLELTL